MTLNKLFVNIDLLSLCVININIMLSFSDLELRETGFQSSQGVPGHRCDLVALGVSHEKGDPAYNWVNESRSEGCLFQYTLEGSGRFQSVPEGRPVSLPAGTGFLAELPSRTRYWLEPGDHWGFVYVILDGDMARDLVRLLLSRHGAVWELPSEHPALVQLQQLHLRVCEDRIPDAFELSATAYGFLMELFRSGPNPGKPLSEPVNRALRFMEMHFSNPDLSMAEMEAAAGCSRYHLSRLFRRETGSSPYATLQDLRIRNALHLLNHSGDAVKEIAWKCGYRDTANFCREFKHRTHRTPTQARKLNENYKFSRVYTP